MRRVLLDTDIGHDIDDVYALALAAQSAAIELVGVATSGGSAAERAALIRELLERAGCDPVPPVYAGCDGGLEGELTHRLSGPGDDSGSAPGPLLEAVPQLLDEGPLTIVCIGGFVNAAALLATLSPERAARLDIVAMGGSFSRNYQGRPVPAIEGNVYRDVDAARAVLSGAAPVTLVPLDCTWDLAPDPVLLAAVHDDAEPLGAALATLHGQWRRAFGFDMPILHDPFTVALVCEPRLARLVTSPVSVGPDGLTRFGGEGPVVRIAVEPKRSDFFEYLGRQLAAAHAAR